MKNRPSAKIRVLLVDDHVMFLEGIKLILSSQSHIEVVGEAINGEEALSKAKELDPDIVLLDISMPLMNGLEVAFLLKKETPNTKVILLSMHDDKEYVAQFVKSGACGYVLKTSPPDELLYAIESIHAGGAFFSPQISQTLLREQQTSKHKSASELTEREETVLTLIAKGYSSKQIAHTMYISLRTVGKYREMIMQKLQMHSVAELTKYAISKKLIELEKA